MRNGDVVTLLRRHAYERRSKRVQVGLTLDPADRALLQHTAAAARCSQMGVLRIGLKLAAQAVAALQD